MILYAVALEDGVPRRGFELLACRPLFGNMDVLGYTKSRRKLRLEAVTGNVFLEAARIGGKFVNAACEVDFIARPSGRSGILAGDQDTLAIIVEIHGEPGNALADFAFRDGAFGPIPAIIDDIQKSGLAGF